MDVRRLLSDLTELQVSVSDVNARYDALGRDLKERLGRQQASLELRQKVRQGAEELRSWLSEREDSLRQGQTSSPSRPEAVRAQAQHNKVRPVETLQLLQPRELPALNSVNVFLSFRLCWRSWPSTPGGWRT